METSSLSDNPLFDLQEAIYLSKNPTRRRLHQMRLRWVREALADHGRSVPLSRAIEYGPGSGLYLPELLDVCDEVIAADVEMAYLSGIHSRLSDSRRISLIVDDIQDSKFADQTFGLALCSEVLEHIQSPELGLKTLYRILAPGGIAVVTTPQRFSLMELSCKIAFLPGAIQLVRRIYREPVLETGHISLRTQSAFQAAIAAAGFQIIRQERFGLYLPLLAEFGGMRGGRLIERLEARMYDSRWSWALWTQAYVLGRHG